MRPFSDLDVNECVQKRSSSVVMIFPCRLALFIMFATISGNLLRVKVLPYLLRQGIHRSSEGFLHACFLTELLELLAN